MCIRLRKQKKDQKEIVFPYQFYRGWSFPIIKFYMAKNTRNAPVKMAALVDSGANISIFNKEAATALGITMWKGKRRSFTGIGGGTYGYEHEVYFDVLGETFKDKIIFSSQLESYFNLIGRESFFAQFAKICFDENKGETVLVRK